MVASLLAETAGEEDDWDSAEMDWDKVWAKAVGHAHFADNDSAEEGEGRIRAAPVGPTARGIVEARTHTPLILKFANQITIEVPPDGSSISTKIWRSSLLGLPLLAGELIHLPTSTTIRAPTTKLRTKKWEVAGKDVLELGCGRGLMSLGSAALGARRTVATDCDDRALEMLRLLSLPPNLELMHFLWEQDQSDEAEEQDESVLLHGQAPRYIRQRHWSDGNRGDFPTLERTETFDFVLACDCLYFTSQEEPLAATLKRRVRKPDGKALVIIQTRGNGGYQAVRFSELLAKAGFWIEKDEGPFDWQGILKTLVRSTSGQEGENLGSFAMTGGEVGEPYVLNIGWM